MRRGVTVLEVVIALAIGLIIVGVMMQVMRSEARLRESVDGQLTAENIPAVLHRHLSRDLSRVPLVKGQDAVKLTEEGRALELKVQTAPAQLTDRRLDLPVKTVRYRLSEKGAVVREEDAAREVLPIDGLGQLTFAREAATEPGAQDMLRVSGYVEAKGAAPKQAFSLAFPVGARKPGKVRWSSLIKGMETSAPASW